MSYRKPAALLAALLSLAAGPALAEIALVQNGTSGAVTLEFDGRSYVLEGQKGVSIDLSPRSVPVKVTFADGRAYSSTLNFQTVDAIEDFWADGPDLWCVSIGLEMMWIDPADECDFWVNG